MGVKHWAFGFVVALAVCIGCGGGGGSGSSTNGGLTSGSTSGTTSGSTSGSTSGTAGDIEATRGEVIDALMADYIELAPRSHPENRAAFIAAAKANPAIEDAGWATDGDNFWARFKDGLPYAILDNRPPSAPEPVPTIDGGRVAKIPASKTAVLIQTLGTAFQDFTATEQAMLSAAGYTPVKNAGTVEALTTGLKGPGYLWFSTHSGEFEVSKGVMEGCITTASNYSSGALKTSTLLKGLADKDMLVFTSVLQDQIANPVDKNGNKVLEQEEKFTFRTALAVRPKFISTYFAFGDGSVVLQDSCISAAPATVKGYQDAGANVYVGWDKVTTSTLQMPRLTDRLLGGNALTPKDNPPTRAFDLNAVWTWLTANSYDKASNGAKMLKFLKTGTDNSILTPSIERLTIKEGLLPTDVDILTIKGTFGPDPRSGIGAEVTVAGTPLTKFRSWKPDEIVVEIPTTGAGSAGDCIVKVGDRISNTVPITLWTVGFKNYSDMGWGGTVRVELNFSLKFRGDVHKSRSTVAGTASGPTVTMLPRRDSTFTWTASGSSTKFSTAEPPCAETFSGSGLATMDDIEVTLSGQMAVNVATGQITSLFAAGAVNKLGAIKSTDCEGSESPNVVGSMGDPSYLPPVAFVPGTLNVKAGASGPRTWAQGDMVYGYEWSASTPQFPPASSTKA